MPETSRAWMFWWETWWESGRTSANSLLFGGPAHAQNERVSAGRYATDGSTGNSKSADPRGHGGSTPLPAPMFKRVSYHFSSFLSYLGGPFGNGITSAFSSGGTSGSSWPVQKSII
jgi:hypothetical protein